MQKATVWAGRRIIITRIEGPHINALRGKLGNLGYMKRHDVLRDLAEGKVYIHIHSTFTGDIGIFRF